MMSGNRLEEPAPCRMLIVAAAAILLMGSTPGSLQAQSRGNPTRVTPWQRNPESQRHNLPPVPDFNATVPEVWTPEAALARALAANPDVQVALASVERQEGQRLQAAARLFPRVSVTGSIDQRAETLIDRDPRVPAGVRNDVAEHSYSARFEGRQLLFDGLASWHQLRRMGLLKKKGVLDARDMYLRIASQVRQVYDAILLRQTVRETRRQAVSTLGQLAEVAQRRFAVGAISEYESLRAQTALRSAEADLAQADAELSRAQEMFCRLLYIPSPSEELKLEGDLELRPFGLAFDEAISRAYAERLDLKGAELQLEAAKLGQRIAIGDALPKIEGFVSYDYRSSYYDFDRQLDGWVVGLAGRWDFFDGGATRGSIRVQRAERRAAEIRLAEAQQTIGSQIRDLYSALEQAKTVMAAQETARDLGARSLREAQRLFEVGRLSTEDVLNAQIAYRQAQIAWLGAVFRHNTTVYQIDYAIADDAFLNGL